MNTRRLPMILALFFSVLIACQSIENTKVGEKIENQKNLKVLPGAYDLSSYLSTLEGLKVGAVVNHTSQIGDIHLIDTLMSLGVDLQLIFAPEHGFKGTAYNGEEIADGLYKEEVPIRSLYGKTKKPSIEDLKMVDVILFDIQDVGARFYTYISTLHYVMEAAAENQTKVIILDRPNPNGHYVDGPVMDPSLTSFVGMHEVPIVYGMTIGEYGQMINGEGWLTDGLQCSLEVVPVSNYTHDTPYDLPIAPSPNLPNARSILLYPSLCFLEGTVMNEGRGTDKQFQIYGHPKMNKTGFSYTPVSMTSSKYPKQQDRLCGGIDLTNIPLEELRSYKKINLSYLKDSYDKVGDQQDEPFFLVNGWIHKLSGTTDLKDQIINRVSAEEIRQSWTQGLDRFKITRAKYLIYD